MINNYIIWELYISVINISNKHVSAEANDTLQRQIQTFRLRVGGYISGLVAGQTFWVQFSEKGKLFFIKGIQL